MTFRRSKSTSCSVAAVWQTRIPFTTGSAARTPVHWSERLNSWVLTKYDDVRAASRDRRFANNRASVNMSALSEPDRTRFRPLGEHVPTSLPVPTPQGSHVKLDLRLNDGDSEVTAKPGDELQVLVHVDTNGELVTAGMVRISWDPAALVARGFVHGDLIGSSPRGGYGLVGPANGQQGELAYAVYDENDPDVTPPGTLVTITFMVGDGSFGNPLAEAGRYAIRLESATLTDDPTAVTSPDLEVQFESVSYETYIRDAFVVNVTD